MAFYTSLSGLQGAQTELNTISNNIANASTNGFKKSTVQFGDIIASSPGQAGNSVTGQGQRLEGVVQQMSQGSFQTTDRALDVAISGDGFFTTVAPVGGAVTYTRNGSFSIDANNNVVDSLGNSVQVLPVDSSGNVTSTTTTASLMVPATPTGGSATAKLSNLSIGADGLVTATYSDGTSNMLGKLAMATFPNSSGLTQHGNGLWSASGTSGAATLGQAGSDGFGSLQSGALETSNVDITSELVSLIAAQQNFQANSKAIDTDKQMTSTILNMQ